MPASMTGVGREVEPHYRLPRFRPETSRRRPSAAFSPQRLRRSDPQTWIYNDGHRLKSVAICRAGVCIRQRRGQVAFSCFMRKASLGHIAASTRCSSGWFLNSGPAKPQSRRRHGNEIGAGVNTGTGLEGQAILPRSLIDGAITRISSLGSAFPSVRMRRSHLQLHRSFVSASVPVCIPESLPRRQYAIMGCGATLRVMELMDLLFST